MKAKPEIQTNIHYHEYLKIDALLGAQKPISVEKKRPAHDEMLFIIVHQTYELWFKQVIHELQSAVDMFSAKSVDEAQMGVALQRLDRISEIFELLLQQIDVLETMTPLDFLEFRDLLYPASGFQSFQFRIVENMLGLKTSQRLLYNNQSYLEQIPESHRHLIKNVENSKSLFELIETWLERTPFLNLKGFNFWEEYQSTVISMFEQDKEVVLNNPYLGQQDRDRNIKLIEKQLQTFADLFDESNYENLRKDGFFRLSYKAIHAALLIQLYRDQPILHLPFRIITKLQDIDSLLTTWRYRHAIMVHRMLGKKIGTGGSSGHEYLAQATEQHKVFVDFNNLTTFFIPRSKLPKIPKEVEKELGFYYRS